MGGTGYFGILAIMWMVFPIYVSRVGNLKEAVLKGIIIISLSYLLISFINLVNGIVGLDNSGVCRDWLYYLFRGIYCYALGCILYHISKRKTEIITTSSSLKKVSIYSALALIALKMVTQGSGFDGLWFSVLWCMVLLLSINEKILLIDNRVFAFLGKNITELFVAHIVLYYVLVQNQQVLEAGKNTFVILFAMSIIVAPILQMLISKPMGMLNKKLYSIIFEE